MFDILRKKYGVTLKLCPLIEYYIQNIFMGKNHAEIVHQKLAPDPFLICQTTQNRPCMQKILLKIRNFERLLSKSLKKVNFNFFFWIQSPLMGKVIKNNRGLELFTSRSSGYETRSKKFLYLLYYLTKFDDAMWSSFWVIAKIVFAVFMQINSWHHKLFHFHLSFWIWKL